MTKDSAFWSSGSQIVYREVWGNRIWTARPMTVVQDTPELLVLFLRAGTTWKLPAGRRDDFIRFLQSGLWKLADAVWLPGSVLYLIPPGHRYAVWVMRDSDEKFSGWYINIQEPVRRTPIGFDSMDQELDIVVSPNRDVWQWKDEAELLEAQTLGIYSVQQVMEIRAAAQEAIDRLKANDSLFANSWAEWLPPATWQLPQFPPGWDEL